MIVIRNLSERRAAIMVKVLLTIKVSNVYFYYLQRNLIINIQGKAVTKVRADLSKKLLYSSLAYFGKLKVGDVITRITSDTGKLEGLLANTIVSFLTDSLTLLTGIIVLLFLHWKLALLSIAIVPLFLICIKFFSNRLKNTSSELQKELSKLTSSLFEAFLSMSFVKAFGTETIESNRINDSLEGTLKAKIKAERLNAVSSISANFIGALGRFVLIWYGLSEIINGSLTIGAFLAFNSFLRYIYDPSKNLMNLNSTIQQSMASLERVTDISIEADSSREKDGDIELKSIKGEVSFKNVNFSYDTDRGLVLKNINFDIAPSSTVAIVGTNGSGKTTLINLLLRLYQPNSGIITIDNINIESITAKSLKSQIGFVPQDMYLLSNTIAYNINYGTDSKTIEEIIEAAKMAEAHDFINKLPSGYETVVGEKGISYNFSGGEKQRLAIARAFLKQPKILIFDEATSSIDNESVFAIRKAMKKLMINKTTFIIAHRLSTIINADKILVLHQGNLVQTGNHESLLNQDGLYRNLYEKEFIKE